MALILEEVDIKLDFNDLTKRINLVRPLQAIRPPGIHQSSVLAYIARAIKVLGPEEKFEDEYPLIWALGQAWEEFCFSLYPEITYQPGSKCHNRIWRSVDGKSVLYHPWLDKVKLATVEESKFTYKKVKIGDEFLKEWLYMEQGKGYCSMEKCRHVRYHVMYVRGDYKNFGPMYRRYLVEFTDLELTKSEDMLAKNRDSAEPEVR